MDYPFTGQAVYFNGIAFVDNKNIDNLEVKNLYWATRILAWVYAKIIRTIFIDTFMNIVNLISKFWKIPKAIKDLKSIKSSIKEMGDSEIEMLTYLGLMSANFEYTSDPLKGIIDYVNWPIVHLLRGNKGDCDDFGFWNKYLFKYFLKTHKGIERRFTVEAIYITIIPQRSLWEMMYNHIIFYAVDNKTNDAHVFSSGAVYTTNRNSEPYEGLFRYVKSHYGINGGYVQMYNKDRGINRWKKTIPNFRAVVWSDAKI